MGSGYLKIGYLRFPNGNRYLRRHGRRNDPDFTQVQYILVTLSIKRSRWLHSKDMCIATVLMSSIFDINLLAVNFLLQISDI